MCKNSDSFKCDLCGSNSYIIKNKFNMRLSLTDTPYNLVQCKKCSLIRLYPLPEPEAFENIYENYSSKNKRLNVEKIRLKKVYPLKLKKLKQYSKGKRLLDIGAGLGTFVYAAKKEGFDASGVEYDKNQCEKAKELWNVDLISGMIEDHYKKLGKFDVITLHHVLEHVYSPDHILDIVYKLLNKQGVCLIEVPNQFFNINKEIRLIFGRDFKKTKNNLHHLTFFSVKTLKNYIDKDRFETLELNQFRSPNYEGSFLKCKVRIMYRTIINCFELSGGDHIELYIRKL